MSHKKEKLPPKGEPAKRKQNIYGIFRTPHGVHLRYKAQLSSRYLF